MNVARAVSKRVLSFTSIVNNHRIEVYETPNAVHPYLEVTCKGNSTWHFFQYVKGIGCCSFNIRYVVGLVDKIKTWGDGREHNEIV